MRTKKELYDYALKLEKVANYQRKANEGKRCAIKMCILVGYAKLLGFNYLIGMFTKGDEYILRFIAIILYTITSGYALYEAKTALEEKDKCEKEILKLERELKR